MSNNAYTPNTGVKAPIDPGWNDPPKLAYNAQTTPNRPRNVLNKRVAFPLSNTAPSPGAPNVIMPPMPATASFPPIPPPQVFSNVQKEEVVLDRVETLKEVKSILLELLEVSTELGPKSNDIRRRIDVMEDMWLSEKLNNSIYVQMKNLAHALKDDKPSQADEIHRALMIEHVSAVGTWMPGIKQLIHNCIARLELLSIDKE